MSHTGSLAGNDLVYDAAFKRVGILRVGSISDLFDCAHTLSMQKRPAGTKLFFNFHMNCKKFRLCIVTNAGGPGVIATDSLISLRGQLAKLSTLSMEALNKVLPQHWSHGNPVDILGDASPEVYSIFMTSLTMQVYRSAVDICLKDVGVDGVVVILTPQSMTNPTEVARKIVTLPHGKVILASWMGATDVAAGIQILEQVRFSSNKYYIHF